MTQLEKGTLFRQLHHRATAFIIPNPWDPGTARLLASLGFEALATTSAGFAFSQGVTDNSVPRDAMLAHLADIAQATPLPVSADLENGFGDSLEQVADTYRLAAATGIVGASIEDATNNPNQPIFPLPEAIERVRVVATVVHSLSFPFTLTARAENYLHGNPNLSDTIQRLQAYQEAGADVLYAPGLVSQHDIETVVRSVQRPVNVLAGVSGQNLTLAQLSDLGVRRVSIGSALSRAGLRAFLNAAKEMATTGSFTFTSRAIPFADLTAMFE